ncbi:hypothetical protein Y1Q_0004655 [Alligator mississippiensis]|uniref:Uncharacterized protein n=1 Tax=Alligator mississippiensis TaxID=8496 RepID=A0A151MHQ9_ALLMI|nr:hypothetical protein Y1Q_0004655 [Alligator mississippiensis]
MSFFYQMVSIYAEEVPASCEVLRHPIGQSWDGHLIDGSLLRIIGGDLIDKYGLALKCIRALIQSSIVSAPEGHCKLGEKKQGKGLVISRILRM